MIITSSNSINSSTNIVTCQLILSEWNLRKIKRWCL